VEGGLLKGGQKRGGGGGTGKVVTRSRGGGGGGERWVKGDGKGELGRRKVFRGGGEGDGPGKEKKGGLEKGQYTERSVSAWEKSKLKYGRKSWGHPWGAHT